MIQFDNTYQNLPPSFYAKVNAEKVSKPTLFAFNKQLAEELGLDLRGYSEVELSAYFAGQTPSSTASSIAMAYAGHQFGSLNPQLGDGRAMLLGEVLTPEGKRFDLQLKGAGRTPFSRNGDGKSALGPVIREYIVSEAMHYLGVPTTRSLAAVTTGDLVFREGPIAGGILTRVASSHIRIGTFAYFAAKGDVEGLKTLMDYSIQRHYPEQQSAPNPALSFLIEVAERQASMVAQWMSFGFIHGVMNTDNMLISGETIDYGPCAFMDNFSAHRVFSSIDRNSRYRYSNQINIAKWNVTQLANCLLPLIHPQEQESIQIAQEALDLAFQSYEDEWLRRMAKKLGIFAPKVEDQTLVADWLQILEEQDLDFTLSFRALSDESSSLLDKEKIRQFTGNWKERLDQQSQSWEESKELMESLNPIYIPRNHQVERAIQGALQGDYLIFEEMNRLLQQPFAKQPDLDKYHIPPNPEERIQATFCGT